MDAMFADPWFQSEFREAGSSRYDFISRDERTIVEIRSRAGIRDIQGGILGLVVALTQTPTIDRAVLVLIRPFVSHKRLQEEWDLIRASFRPELAARLALIAFHENATFVDPPDNDFLRRVALSFQTHVEPVERLQMERSVPLVTTAWRRVEITKVLVIRWLRRLGPVAIGQLADQVGCSYATAGSILTHLQRRNLLTRHSNRSVELARFPHESWRELLTFARGLRMTHYYADTSGRPAHPVDLLSRLRRIQPQHVALGGVEAARHWQPRFDLNGLPRLDLICHSPGANPPDLGFVQQLDPALQRVGPTGPSLLAVSILRRSDSPFDDTDQVGLPWADPLETVLDLYDQRLDVQAGQLLSHLRHEVRL